MTAPAAPLVTISVNDEPMALPAGVTVAELLRRLGVDGRGTAVALNAAVVPRSSWERVTLAASDRVEVLTVAQGG